MTGAWLLACLGLVAAALCCAAAAWHGDLTRRLSALQVLIALASLLLAALTYAFDQPALIDLALALAVLNLPGAVLFALFTERSL